MGLILSALAAAGDAGVQSITQQQQSDLEVQKAKAIADYTMQLQNQQRATMVDSTNKLAQGYADQRAAGQNGIINANADQANELFPPGMASSGTEGAQPIPVQGIVNDNDLVRARVAAGYTDPIELVKLNHAEAQNAMMVALQASRDRMNDLREQHNDAWQKAQANKDDTNNRRIDAMFAKIGAGGEGKPPAEVAATQWYLDHQDDPKAMAAWDKVHEGKSKNIITLAADFIVRDPNAGGKNAITVDQAYQMATTLYDKAGQRGGAAPAPGAKASAAPKTLSYNPKTGKIE